MNRGAGMRKKLAICLMAVVLAGVVAGCAAGGNDTQPEQNAMEAQLTIEEGIVVSGTMVEAAGKTFDLAEKNPHITSVVSCRWLEKTKIAVQSLLTENKGQKYYFAVYDVVRDIYVYEQYGAQFIWQNDDLNTLVYVLDYAGEDGTSKVCSKKDVVLYESSIEERIQNVAFVPKGIKVEVTDLRGDNPRQVIVEAAV